MTAQPGLAQDDYSCISTRMATEDVKGLNIAIIWLYDAPVTDEVVPADSPGGSVVTRLNAVVAVVELVTLVETVRWSEVDLPDCVWSLVHVFVDSLVTAHHTSSECKLYFSH